jgi:hypothetical protein
MRSDLRTSSARKVPLGTFGTARISARTPHGLWDQEISAIYSMDRHVRLPDGIAPKAAPISEQS